MGKQLRAGACARSGEDCAFEAATGGTLLRQRAAARAAGAAFDGGGHLARAARDRGSRPVTAAQEGHRQPTRPDTGQLAQLGSRRV